MIVLTLYALLCAAGGLIGFIKAGSLVSLFIGLGTAILIFISILFLSLRHRWPTLLTLFISLALMLHFSLGLLHQFKLMPHLVMVLASAIAAYTSLRLRTSLSNPT